MRDRLEILGASYFCTCPDYSRTTQANPYEDAFSGTIDRDFSSSSSGSPEGVPCKHMYSSLRLLSDGNLPESIIPLDFPTPETYPRRRRIRNGWIGNQATSFSPKKVRQLKPVDPSRRKA